MNSYDQNEQYQQSQVDNTIPPVQGSNPTFVSGLILSIVQIIFVPCLYGVIPLILTIVANSSWKQGSYELYEKRTKAANIFLIIGWVILGIEAIVVIGGLIYLFYAMVTSGF